MKRKPNYGVEIPQARNCYACDSQTIVGVRDRRPEGGDIEAACRRHADPTVKSYHPCMFCNTPVRRGGVDTGDGLYAHAKCERAEMR